MNKQDLVRSAVNRLELSQKDASHLIDGLFDDIQAAAAAGETLDIPGFGHVRTRSIRQTRMKKKATPAGESLVPNRAKSQSWSLEQSDLKKPRRPQVLYDVHPLLNHLIDSFGSNAVARLVDVKPSTVTNWKNRKRSMDLKHARRVTDLYYVLARAFQTFQPNTAMRWLSSRDPFLDEQRPLDVLVLQGPSRLVAALDAHEAGAYP